jgi:hypothetical protein
MILEHQQRHAPAARTANESACTFERSQHVPDLVQQYVNHSAQFDTACSSNITLSQKGKLHLGLFNLLLSGLCIHDHPAGSLYHSCPGHLLVQCGLVSLHARCIDAILVAMVTDGGRLVDCHPVLNLQQQQQQQQRQHR